ncbi:MAG: DUF4417 domain-containing protein [Lachnospiraceae bacterium]|nr:DUF4417 domain-containing protein [Lachnospiraceae bacterium]
MYKKNRKAILDDGCNPELVANAIFDGIMEMPTIKAHKHIYIPKGIVPFSQIDRIENPEDEAIGSFEMDDNFSDLIINPDEYVERILQFGAFISPDCSLYRSATLPVQIINIYRSRAIGVRYQEKGAYVIPLVRWGNELTYTTKYFPEKIAFLGVEKKSIVAIGTYGCIQKKEDKYHFEAGLYEMMQTLEPEVVLVNGSAPPKIFNPYESYSKFVIYPDWTSRMHKEVD